MLDEAVREILDSIDENSFFEESFPKFSGDGYIPHKIDAKNFHEIRKISSGKKIAFIDGGNAEIIGSANFSLNLIRAAYAIYGNNRKIAIKKSEVLAFVKAVNKDNEIHFKSTFFNTNRNLELDEISFSSFDRTLMLGINRAEIGSVANAIRRLAELKMARYASDSKLADIIVLDGNLQCTFTNEWGYMNDLQNSCRKNGVVLSGLSKTTSLFTENGNLLSAVLSRIGNHNSWFYYPIVDIENNSHKAEMYFVKLHDKSKHVFRLEILKEQGEEAEQVINEIASNCCDPIFIGYPYGLVEVDSIARIPNQENESLKTMLLAKLRNRNIEKYLNAVNAHEILDRISF